jgi:hypothetical protein
LGMVVYDNRVFDANAIANFHNKFNLSCPSANDLHWIGVQDLDLFFQFLYLPTIPTAIDN